MNAPDHELTVAESLARCSFCPQLQGRTKLEVIGELIDALVGDGLLSDRDEAIAAVLSREEQMSTGMQFGIALPHGKPACVPALVSAIGVAREGIDFEALDGEPSRIFVMTLSPPTTVGPHLRFLAAIGKLLGRPAVRHAVIEAADKHALLAALKDGG
ncbi:MAG TPA: PTS sucrose transporter subunit IIABC [Verrucomicrobia bacterium]|nr:PTS sucrose transporter subunit IIABC [Verrucomicrobiota bacterium]